MMDFTAVNARARGLSAHLLTRSELESLCALEPSTLPRALTRIGKLGALPTGPVTAATVEHAVRHALAHHQSTLARWAGSSAVLGVFHAGLDRTSLRALLRGAQQAAPAQLRLAGLLPTPLLPERVLQELARQPTPGDVVAHLVALQHPYAARLIRLTSRKAQPDLFALDLALVQAFGDHAAATARSGDANLRDHVALVLDVLNAQAAAVLTTSGDVDVARCFVDGGSLLPLRDFMALARSPWQDRARVLQRRWSGTPLARLLTLETDGSGMERRGAALLLAHQRREARQQPLSSAPTLAFLLGLEAMARDVRQVAWASDLGAPASLVRSNLVTPWN